ncbi:MAG: NAD(P)-dependent oxidoreductase [Vicinamibacteraceae bacterium]
MTGAGAARRIAVTGASGFIGSAVLRAALGRRLAVTGFSRRALAVDGAVDGAEWVRGDLADRRLLESALRGADAVVHAAGLAHRTGGLPPDAWRIANVDGTRAVVEAAAAVGVGRVVVVSSVAVYGSHGHVVDESTVCRPVGAYATSKRQAELEARRIADRASLALCLVRPATVAGAGDPGSVARLARLLHADRFVALGDGSARKCLIGVDDVADALLRIATAEIPDDGTYNVAGTPVSLAQIVEVLASALGAGGPRLRIPQRVVRLALTALTSVEHRSSRAGWASHGLRAWLADHVYDVSRFEGRYGALVRTPWSDVLRQEAHWLRGELGEPLNGSPRGA